MVGRAGAFAELLGERIVVLDGAMGTEIQRRNLEEVVLRGDRFADHTCDLARNLDILNLTRPDIVGDIHSAYLAAGADVIQTNTFNATAIVQSDYGTQSLTAEINRAGAEIARQAADKAMQDDSQRLRFVAGVLGPTTKMASPSPDFDESSLILDDLIVAYREAAAALVAGGADLIMLETVFDTLNAKAAVDAVLDLGETLGTPIPLMISGTVARAPGRMKSGQTPDAFWHALSYGCPATIGLNCGFGARALRPHLQMLAGMAPVAISVHPNAGLPNAAGGYDETPAEMAAVLRSFAEEGLVNVVGGCCGTTPAFVAAIADAVRGLPPRKVPSLAQPGR